ncbi:dTDP-4-dehydrorhamnose 3,5-epimerase family protein [Candidatus Woesearchaeota archaeon]|nr:dTDP-4-dehydrorhamnose 3,5-epimerase family protein [Candidatus Woesearchaeota archaeon]
MSLETKSIAVHRDGRGWLAEIFKPEIIGSKFGQVNITTAHPGVCKANHYHRKKNEWYCVIKGKMKLVLKDMKTGKMQEAIFGEDELKLVRIKAGTAHGFKNIGKDMLYLLYYVDTPYNPKNPDTYPAELIK